MKKTAIGSMIALYVLYWQDAVNVNMSMIMA